MVDAGGVDVDGRAWYVVVIYNNVIGEVIVRPLLPPVPVRRVPGVPRRGGRDIALPRAAALFRVLCNTRPRYALNIVVLQ